MKKISKILIIISNFFYNNLSYWIENNLYEFSNTIGRLFFQLALKIYPNNFCHHCGHILEKCYNPKQNEPIQYFCCNCYRTIYEDDKQ